MAIPKVMGTEIEYGITVKGDTDFDPISGCVLLVNAYREDYAGEILWDYDQENPLADARGFQVDGEKYTPNQQENIARNKTLMNGARYYVDHAHPEYSCPEVTNVRDLVVHEKAGERILEMSRREANALLPGGTQMLIYKNNSDRKGNSYGSHENYLMDRRTSFKQIVENLMPFFVTRQIFCGAGKVGAENRSQPVDYQISQRADFFETEVALDTMVKRPIINTRDEPHADREKDRRLHVIVGDANLSEYTIYLRNGVTALVLSMIEDGAVDRTWR
jgi:proteasome accessory factor A